MPENRDKVGNFHIFSIFVLSGPKDVTRKINRVRVLNDNGENFYDVAVLNLKIGNAFLFIGFNVKDGLELVIFKSFYLDPILPMPQALFLRQGQ